MTTNRMGLEQTLSNADLIAIASAAEEVISAIAGDNEEVHPDNSTKMCALWDDLNDRHAPPEVVKSVVLELLARREAIKEPVAPFGYVHQCDHFFTNDHGNIYKTPGGNFTRPLYSAPPPLAVTVPDAIEPDYDVIKGILPTSNPDEYACCIAADMWNACRAAMLKSITNEP